MSCAIRANKYGKKNRIIAISVTHRNRWDYLLDLQRIQDLVLCLQRAMFSNVAWEVIAGNIQAHWLLSQEVETQFRKNFKTVRF